MYSTNTHIETSMTSIIQNVITLCTLGEFNTLFLPSADFIFQNSVRNTIRVPNGLYLDQDRRSVGTDLGTNCLQKLSADTKNAADKKRVRKPRK